MPVAHTTHTIVCHTHGFTMLSTRPKSVTVREEKGNSFITTDSYTHAERGSLQVNKSIIERKGECGKVSDKRMERKEEENRCSLRNKHAASCWLMSSFLLSVIWLSHWGCNVRASKGKREWNHVKEGLLKRLLDFESHWVTYCWWYSMGAVMYSC